MIRTILACYAVAAFATPALACPPPPGPPPQNAGESAEAYNARLPAIRADELRRFDATMLSAQQQYWEQASTIVIARVARLTVVKPGIYGGMRRAVLKPVATLKGPPIKRGISIADTGMTDCGAYGGGDATAVAVGEGIALYFGPGRPSQKTMIEAVGNDRLRDPRLLPALAAVR